jgi:hypothetical protein
MTTTTRNSGPIPKIQRRLVREYKRQLHNFIITSRFNNKTWHENEQYRIQHNLKGCIYCSPSQVTVNIPTETILFVLEMNNETNKIIGIGMIRNKPKINRYTIYNERNYNRYVFTGKTRIDRVDMTEDECDIMRVFDILCFTGNRHLKRGQGLVSFPLDMLYRCNKRLNLVDFISNMFRTRMRNNISNPTDKQ